MKIVILSALALLFSFNTHSAPYPLPRNFCYAGCSPQQATIWNQFENSITFSSTRKSEVYSGACYHLSSLYGADDAHYAGVLIDRNEAGALTFSARFSFYAPQNDYAHWDLTRARSEFGKRHVMQLGPTEAFLDLNPGGETIWYYWLRDAKESGDLLLIATWGQFHQVFCQLTPNNLRSIR